MSPTNVQLCGDVCHQWVTAPVNDVIQIQREKFQLFQLLMYVPRTVIKHLTKSASHGYDAMRLQVDAAQSSAGVNDNEERDMEEREVR